MSRLLSCNDIMVGKSSSLIAVKEPKAVDSERIVELGSKIGV